MCHLLRMPAEIRNEIYAYALSFQYGLKYYHDRQFSTGHMQVADANTLTNLRMDWESEDHAVMILHDANQLKFVNKQLRLETRSLVLRYNDIIFHNIRDTSLFLSKCSTWYYEDFRTFKIQKDSFGRRFPHSIQDLNSLRQVFNFCRQAPHVQVQNLQNVTDIPYAYSPFFPQEATTLRYVMRNQKDWRDILIPEHLLSDSAIQDVPLMRFIRSLSTRPQQELHHQTSVSSSQSACYLQNVKTSFS
jgi:hypothetical protein